MRAKVKDGWSDAGRSCTILGEDVFILQNWTPVLWDDEEDPTFVKSAALEKQVSKVDIHQPSLWNQQINNSIPKRDGID